METLVVPRADAAVVDACLDVPRQGHAPGARAVDGLGPTVAPIVGTMVVSPPTVGTGVAATVPVRGGAVRVRDAPNGVPDLLTKVRLETYRTTDAFPSHDAAPVVLLLRRGAVLPAAVGVVDVAGLVGRRPAPAILASP